MTTSSENKSLLQKLHKIMSEVDFIEKDKTNKHFNYNYVSEYAIKTELHKRLVAHGILFNLNVAEATREGEVTTAKFSYRFIEVETGQELTGTFVGQGYDSTDKGIWKAVTGAIKYILTSTFLIPTGDDPEDDSKEVDRPSRATSTVKRSPAPSLLISQREEIKVVLKDLGYEPKTVAEASETTKKLTQLAFEPANYREILSRLLTLKTERMPQTPLPT